VLEPLLRVLAGLAGRCQDAADFVASQDPGGLLSLLRHASDRIKASALSKRHRRCLLPVAHQCQGERRRQQQRTRTTVCWYLPAPHAACTRHTAAAAGAASADPGPLLLAAPQLRAVGLLDALGSRRPGLAYISGGGPELLQQLLALALGGACVQQAPLQVAAIRLLARLAAHEGPHTPELLQPSNLAQLLHLAAQHATPREPGQQQQQPEAPPAAAPAPGGTKGKPAPAASAPQQAAKPAQTPPLAVSTAAAKLLAALCSAFPQAAEQVAASQGLEEVWHRVNRGGTSGCIIVTGQNAGAAQPKATRPASGAKAGAVATQPRAQGAACDSEEQEAARRALLQLLAAVAQHTGSRQALCAALGPGAIAAGLLAILSLPPLPPPAALSPPAAAAPSLAQQHPSRSASPTGKKTATADKAAAQQAPNSAEAGSQPQQQQRQLPRPPSAQAARAALILLVGLVQAPAFAQELLQHVPALGRAILELLEQPVARTPGVTSAGGRSQGSDAEADLNTDANIALRHAAAAAAFEPTCQLLLLLAHRAQSGPEELQLQLLRQLPVPAIAKALSQAAAVYDGSSTGKVRTWAGPVRHSRLLH
jgi:hypothetical protein